MTPRASADMEYQKRPGTSGLGGQLYETKLLALILFRLQHDRTVHNFHLATNMDGLGGFDDISLFVRIDGHDRPIAVFIQVKHKENDQAVIKLGNKEKVKYVTSFMEIKQKGKRKGIASQQSWDHFFDGNFNETDCVFILYTNAKFNITNTESKFENKELNKLLATSHAVGHRAKESNQDVKDFGDCFVENELGLLSEHFVKFLIGKGKDRSLGIMNDEYIQQYHVILREKVVDVSGIRTDECGQIIKWRTLTFKRDFFTTDDKCVSILRDQLLKEMFKCQRRRPSPDFRNSCVTLDDAISLFLKTPSEATLAPLIMSQIDCNESGKLEFLTDRPSQDVELLQQTNMSQDDIGKALYTAKKCAEDYLLSLELKVPVTFGNVDLTIAGDDKKVDRRLKYLTKVVCNLCKEHQVQDKYKVVKIEDDLGDGLLSHNGGLAGTVGNLLIYDRITDMMMFSPDFTSEQNIAEQLFFTLNNLIDDVFKYRFDINTTRFPKLHLDCSDMAREFLSKLIIFEAQSNQEKVEEILKENIQEHLIDDSRDSVMSNSKRGVSVFLHYHDEILKWWRSPTKGTYLNKTTNLYEKAIHNLESEPQISALHTSFYISRAEYLKISFMKWERVSEPPFKLFLTTDTVELTTTKVVEYLKSHFLFHEFAVLNVEFILNMPVADFVLLNEEIRTTKKVLVITWHKKQNYNESDDRLSTLALASKDRQSVVIISRKLKRMIEERFLSAHDMFFEETEVLSNVKSNKEIMKHTKVVFQGREVNLDIILDDESASLVKGRVLDKVIRKETIIIGETLTSAHYEEVKDILVDRSVSLRYNMDDYIFTSTIYSQVPDEDNVYSYDSASSHHKYTSDEVIFNVKTFLDIQSDVVLLTDPPGMGKSTLLTHLSVNTKEHDVTLWIARLNFRDHQKQFRKWQKVDDIEALNLLCQVILRNDNISFDIEIKEGEAYLVSGTEDELADFELSMFLYFYNQKRVIFVFDGFDEICPSFKNKVLQFLSVVKDNLRKYKMWVTSRPYSDLLPDLEMVLGQSYKINYLTVTEQETYLRRFWNKRLLLKNPSEKQLDMLRTFLDNTRESVCMAPNWVRIIYSVFVNTVKPLVFQTSSDGEMDELDKILNIARRMDPRILIFRLIGIPLLLHSLADYFVNIIYCDTNYNNAVLELKLHKVYEMFIKNKLTIYFQEILNVDLSNENTTPFFEKCLHDSINVHRNLAAYPFYKDLTNQMNFEEFREMCPWNEQEWKAELNKIKTGTEKTGLISHVNAIDEPVFVHRSFGEYFVAEYVCDIIKSDRFGLFQKFLWYCAIIQAGYTPIIDWIKMKKETDPILRNAFLEMEKASPICATKYRVYLKRENMSQHQYIRILASSVNDYEDGCFAEYGEKFEIDYLNKFKNLVKRGLNEYFTNYLISKMKPHLKLHFGGPIFFKFGPHDISCVRNFYLKKPLDKIDGILVALKARRHKRYVPLFMLLAHQDRSGTSQLSNTESISKNCQKFQTDDVVETDFIYILLNSGYPGTVHHINDTICTNEIINFLSTTNAIGNQLHYSEKHLEDHVEVLAEKTMEKELTWLARVVETCLEPTIPLLNDVSLYDYVERYDAFLTQHVFFVTNIETNESNCKGKSQTFAFRDAFFNSEHIHIKFLRNCLFEQVLTKKIHFFLESEFWPSLLIPFFFSEPSVATLTLLLGTFVVGFKDNKLEFLVERPPSDVEQLQHINIPQSTINEAKLTVKTATEIYLRSIQVIAPIDLYSIDLPTQSSNDSVPRDLEITRDSLKNAIVTLCKQSTSDKVVTIDDSLDESLLSAPGGLSSCVGNILIYDENTEMLKVQHLDQLTPSQENAKSLYLQLSNEIDDLHEYRFHVRTEKLPKCHLDFANSARDFLTRLLIFAEETVDYEIENIYFKKLNFNPYIQFYDSFTTLNLMRLHIHSEVLKWWKTSNTGKYDCNMCDLYHLAAKNITLEPEISEMHASFYLKNLKYFKHKFSENVTKYKEPPVVGSKLVVVSETVVLTTIKVLRSLKSRGFNNEYAVLDLKKHVPSTFSNMGTLFAELRNTTKVLVVVWTQMSDDVLLYELRQLFDHKRMIFIANNEFKATMETHRQWLDVVFCNEAESLASIQSCEEIMRDTKVIFQGQNVTLNLLMDNESVKYIKGEVLDKVISNDLLHIGKPVGIPQYDEVKGSRIDIRKDQRADDEHQFSFDNLKIIRKCTIDSVALLRSPTDMGMSAVLTHLALNSKEHGVKLWIVRVNFPDHVDQFGRWQDEDTVVDDLESLKFLCQATLNYTLSSFSVTLTEDKAQVATCVGDPLAAFELNLFLHFYNERRVVFVFEAVDEVTPYCEDKVRTFLTVVITRLRKRKMWVTSKSHSDILTGLERVLGEDITTESCSVEEEHQAIKLVNEDDVCSRNQC